MKGRKKFPENRSQKRAEVTILTSDEVAYKSKTVKETTMVIIE